VDQWGRAGSSPEIRQLETLRDRLDAGGGESPDIRASEAVELGVSACGRLPDLRGITDLSAPQAAALITVARILKETGRRAPTAHRHLLPGRTLAALFEKPSLRTRTTFDVGMFQMGGHTVSLTGKEVGLGSREPARDIARNLDRWVDGIAARVFQHSTIQELAAAGRVPVINALCDLEHPCQALADLLTVWERLGSVAGQTIVYLGDGNNVAHSLLLLGTLLGAEMRFCGPPEHQPHPGILAACSESALASGGSIVTTDDPVEACEGADVLYTDVWTSMGQEAEAAQRISRFQPYQVNDELMSLAAPGAVFLHCLPAHRDEEVTDSVMESPASAVFDQSENRLHAQKAVLAVLLSQRGE